MKTSSSVISNFNHIENCGLGEEVRAAEVGAFSPPGCRTQTFQTLKEALLFVVLGGGRLLSFVFSIFSKLLKAPKQTALVTD